jgi:hypothetical protein
LCRWLIWHLQISFSFNMTLKKNRPMTSVLHKPYHTTNFWDITFCLQILFCPVSQLVYSPLHSHITTENSTLLKKCPILMNHSHISTHQSGSFARCCNSCKLHKWKFFSKCYGQYFSVLQVMCTYSLLTYYNYSTLSLWQFHRLLPRM